MRKSTVYVLYSLVFAALWFVPGLGGDVWNTLDTSVEQILAAVVFFPALLFAHPLAFAVMIAGGALAYGVGRMACASRTMRRIFGEELPTRADIMSAHVDFDDRDPLLDDIEFARIVAALANPEDERPERPVSPTPRALTDGAWTTWDEGPQWRSGLPALDRPFTLRTDCQSGHVAEHHMGEHWQEAGTDRTRVTRVTRVCRYVCHSTWSEIV